MNMIPEYEYFYFALTLLSWLYLLQYVLFFAVIIVIYWQNYCCRCRSGR